MEGGTPEKGRLADRLQTSVASWSRWMILVVAAFLLGLVVSIDLVTGSELSFSVFYLIPVAFVAWYVGRGPAFAFAVISAVLWFGADRWTGSPNSLSDISLWALSSNGTGNRVRGGLTRIGAGS